MTFKINNTAFIIEGNHDIWVIKTSGIEKFPMVDFSIRDVAFLCFEDDDLYHVRYLTKSRYYRGGERVWRWLPDDTFIPVFIDDEWDEE